MKIKYGQLIFLLLVNLSIQASEIAKIEDKQTKEALEKFGLSQSEIDNIIDNTKAVIVKRPVYDPFNIETKDFGLIARALWQAYRQKNQDIQISEALDWETLISSALCKELKLENVNLSENDIPILLRLAISNPYLFAFNVYKTKLSQSDVTNICSLFQIKDLRLENAEITDALLAIIAKHPNIEILRLPKNKLTPKLAEIVRQ